MRFVPLALASSLLALLVGCDDPVTMDPPDAAATPSDAGPAFPDVCENISPYDCLLPWPSSRYIVDDSTTATGRRLDLPVEAMPRARRGSVPVDPALFNRFDGFSPATSMVTVLGPDVDRANLPDEDHIADSLEPNSPTVLLEVDGTTVTRIAHFSEPDDWTDQDPDRRAFYIRPAARLREGMRYIVAIRDVRRTDGSAVEPSDYFRALRDDTMLEEPSDIESRRAHFGEIFGLLEGAGVARSSLIQAWDFETASGANIWGDVVAMRDDALRRMETDTEPRCTITTVTDAPAEHVWRRIEGTVRVPLYLGTDQPEPPADVRIQRDGSGAPAFQGYTDVPFVVNIPQTLYDAIRAGTVTEGGRLLDYGHGLFGDRYETSSGWFRELMRRTQMVGLAIDWWGMSTDDVPRVALTLSGNFSDFPATADRLGQGMVNHVALVRAFIHETNGCAALPEFQIDLEGGGTAPAIDRTQRYYYGNSQGGIMGGAVAGIAVDVERFVLGVGGMSYSVMIPRSTNWQTYGAVLRNGYTDPLVRALLMQMAQSQWDLGEPSTFAPHLVRDPLPCAADVPGCTGGLTPVKRILMQIGRDDAQVANITAEIHARTIGIPVLSPSPFPVYGLTEATVAMGEVAAPSALAIYSIPGVPMLPIGTRDPVEDNGAHEGVRRADRAIEQLDMFCRPAGEVVQTCDGVCDPD